MPDETASRQLPEGLIFDEIPLPQVYRSKEWVAQVKNEWDHRDELNRSGICPITSLLLTGKTGIGKSTSARYLAKELNIPVVTLVLSNVVNGSIDQIGNSVWNAIQYTKGTPCLLLLDELDGIAPRRSGPNDIGGSGRMSNVMAQAMDQWNGQERHSIMIGTTNQVDSVDEAVRRRFDREVVVPLPSSYELMLVADTAVPEDSGFTFADIIRLRNYSLRLARVSNGSYDTLMQEAIAVELKAKAK